ncbi:hypothetical protein [Rubellimicrobium mesophilum]|uniref:hypothetical protein n=1 Tax=Rubellimicrobium mesophilum TaxID=1123067 RepID=UPI000564B90D|nr:hypothetical protein [Rubellimicrobium mesophilum]
MNDSVVITVSRHHFPGSCHEFVDEICRQDGQPMRGGELQPTARMQFYESVKLDRLVRPRTYLEAVGVHWSEVATGVVNYDLHPATYRWGEGRMLTPSRREWLADGSIMMVVVREDDYQERDPADVAMLEEAEE